MSPRVNPLSGSCHQIRHLQPKGGIICNTFDIKCVKYSPKGKPLAEIISTKVEATSQILYHLQTFVQPMYNTIPIRIKCYQILSTNMEAKSPSRYTQQTCIRKIALHSINGRSLATIIVSSVADTAPMVNHFPKLCHTIYLSRKYFSDWLNKGELKFKQSTNLYLSRFMWLYFTISSLI